jgi:uncharacterized protein (DUF3084 family)
MSTKIDELFATLRGLIDDQSRDLAMAMGELRSVAAERDKLKLLESFAVDGWNKAVIERDNARQSLRAAEQEVAETDSVNSDLRTINARLVADLAAAMERLNHAESIEKLTGSTGSAQSETPKP